MFKKNKTIDIIMPNYNKGKFITEAVNSVINQSYKNWRLFIIDDNSDQYFSVISFHSVGITTSADSPFDFKLIVMLIFFFR